MSYEPEKVGANGLRKTEYVLYLSHSRRLTFAFLQATARVEEGDRTSTLRLADHNLRREFKRSEIFLFESAVTH